MPNSKLENLKQQIETAFADAPRPADDRIGYDPDDWASAELASTFKGKHWKELTPAELQYNSSTFLSSEGFHYYLPAYLTAALDDYGDLLPRMVYSLNIRNSSSTRDQELDDRRLERFERLSPAQKRAVRAFLEYARDETPGYFVGSKAPLLALSQYWGQD